MDRPRDPLIELRPRPCSLCGAPLGITFAGVWICPTCDHRSPDFAVLIAEEAPTMLPVVTYNPTRDLWILDRPWALVRPEFTLRIPSGFTFDLSSVPRPLWPLCAIHELGIRAPLVHDALYQYAGEIPAEWVAPTRTFRRSEADRLFRELMAEAEISWLRRWAAWAAVRAFGFLAWRRRR